MLSRRTVVYLVAGALAALTFATIASVVANATSKPETTTTIIQSQESGPSTQALGSVQAEMADVVAALERDGIDVASTSVEPDPPLGYVIDIAAADLEEHVFGIDRAFRAAVHQHQLEPTSTVRVRVRVRDADGGVDQHGIGIRLDAFDAKHWPTDPAENLSESRDRLVPAIERLAGQPGTDLLSATVGTAEGTQVLNLTLRQEKDGDISGLTSFLSQVWGLVFQLNAEEGHVGVAYIRVDDAQGNQVVREVVDFLLSFDYGDGPDGYRLAFE